MTRMKIRTNKYLKYLLLLAAGMFLGWLFFHSPGKHEPSDVTVISEAADEDVAEENTIWTCSMHPHIRMDKPGDCPICGMDLIPLGKSGGTSYDPDAIHLSKEAAMLANVMTTVVTSRKAEKEIRLYGRVKVDERLLQNQVAHVPGRIERLNVNFTGEVVKRGQVLAEIYSPELITAQQELLQTYKTRQLQPELYEASKERLRQWKLTEDQINEIESSDKIMSNIKVHSNTSGTVTTLNVNTGDYVSQGSVLYQVADLSKVWILFDAYESDLPFIKKGTKVTFTLQSVPGKKYSGNVSFIDPVLDPVTRVAGVRVETANNSGDIKPEMFVSGIVSSGLENNSTELVIPKSAVLWTGKRSVVYVKEPGDEYLFKMREIDLGPVLGDSYIVADGLAGGEEIVTNGTFSVDAAAQLEGKPSMMNPAGGTTSSGHDHGKLEPSEAAGPGKKDQKINADAKFISQLNEMYADYLSLKNALVAGDPAMAKKSASEMSGSLGKVDMNLLKGDSHEKWMEVSGTISNAVRQISSSDQIEEQRAAFSPLSNNLYTAVKSFGLTNGPSYWQFCPMAFDNKGAYWLSETEEIRNPYFGDAMLTCGEVRETINF